MRQIRTSGAPVDISVIIVSWNAKGYLKECLASLPAAHQARAVETIVVDNGSSDGSAEMVAAEFPEVKLIRLGENRGFAAANNVGIRVAFGRYLALVNSDVIFLDNCLDKLAGFMDQNPTIGISGPRILNRDRTLQDSCRAFPSLWNNFCNVSRLYRLFPKWEWTGGEHLAAFDHKTVRRVEGLVGCFLMARKSAVYEFGLLDEGFFIYAEDIDWCKRCWDAGWEVVFYPDTTAIHLRGGSSANDPVRFDLEQQRAVFRYWKKHRGRCATGLLCGLYFYNYCLRLAAAFVAWTVGKPSRSQAAMSMRRNVRCIGSLCGSLLHTKV